MTTTEIVIASHKETLAWVELFECFNAKLGVLPECEISVYRTGTIFPNAKMLDNHGREAGQWLAHIVHRYDSLADATFFVQADLGAAFGANPNEWPHDLNLLKKFRLPELLDDHGFYIWPTMERVRCVVGEPGLREAHIRGIGPGRPEATPREVFLFWENAPKEIFWPAGGSFLGAQHILTRNFIHRLPKSYYCKALDVVKKHEELAHWLEHGKWPAVIYDIFRQGPLRDAPPAQS